MCDHLRTLPLSSPVATAHQTCSTEASVRAGSEFVALCSQFSAAMAENEEDGAAEQSGDLRVMFICDYVLKTLKQKHDRWSKMISLEESRQIIMDFLEKPELLILVIYQNQTGQLTPSNDFPPTTKAKSVYFVKKERSSVSNQNMKSVLTFGDLSYTPLEQLSSLVDDVSGHHDDFGAILIHVSCLCIFARFCYRYWETTIITMIGLRWCLKMS